MCPGRRRNSPRSGVCSRTPTRPSSSALLDRDTVENRFRTSRIRADPFHLDVDQIAFLGENRVGVYDAVAAVPLLARARQSCWCRRGTTRMLDIRQYRGGLLSVQAVADPHEHAGCGGADRLPICNLLGHLDPVAVLAFLAERVERPATGLVLATPAVRHLYRQLTVADRDRARAAGIHPPDRIPAATAGNQHHQGADADPAPTPPAPAAKHPTATRRGHRLGNPGRRRAGLLDNGGKPIGGALLPLRDSRLPRTVHTRLQAPGADLSGLRAGPPQRSGHLTGRRIPIIPRRRQRFAYHLTQRTGNITGIGQRRLGRPLV